MALNRRLSFDQARLIRQNRILARNGIDPSGQWTPFRGYLILILLRHATRCESNNASIVSQLTYFRPASCHMFSTPAWGSFAVTLIFCQGILSSMFSRDSKYSPLFPRSWNALHIGVRAILVGLPQHCGLLLPEADQLTQ